MSDFLDLSKLEGVHRDECCDVCIVGAGAAGIYLASKLASKGLNIILLEAGGMKCSDASAVDFETRFQDSVYSGATKGRAFGVGGTTSIWGGALLPHTKYDLREPMGASEIWPDIIRRVTSNTEVVLATLGRIAPADFEEYPCKRIPSATIALRSAGLITLAALWLPFRSKNMAFLLGKTSTSAGNIRIFYHAVAKSWTVTRAEGSGDAKVCSLLAVTKNGKSVGVKGMQFVIAAGAIESARILLELNAQSAVCTSPTVGAYLSDHLSVGVADVNSKDLTRTAKLFSPSFSQGWMRNYRLLEVNPPSSAPRAFAHFVFENENPGFKLTKELLTSMQAKRLPQVSLTDSIAGMKGIFAIAYERYRHSVLYIPPDSKAHLQLDLEQTPAKRNRVVLSDENDRYGRRIPIIHWGVSDVDLQNISATATRFLAKWPSEKDGLPILSTRQIGNAMTKPHDTYHPTGTCRMGNDPESVVDINLRVRGLDNLWAINTGVLPSAGTANPTFTMLCLAEALAHDIKASAG